jgi:hypothetical protein
MRPRNQSDIPIKPTKSSSRSAAAAKPKAVKSKATSKTAPSDPECIAVPKLSAVESRTNSKGVQEETVEVAGKARSLQDEIDKVRTFYVLTTHG